MFKKFILTELQISYLLCNVQNDSECIKNSAIQNNIIKRHFLIENLTSYRDN